MFAIPGHRPGKLDHGVKRVEAGPIPMVLEDAPTAFERIILAVVRWIRRETHCHAILLHKLHHPLHELGAATMILWTIIQIEPQGGDGRETSTDRLPPLCEAIHQAVTGHF